MGISTGKDSKFVFGTQTFTNATCIQTTGLDDAINPAKYACSGYDKTVPGTRSAVFNATVALSATDTTKINALLPGATGAFQWDPAGDVTGRIEVVATSAMIISANKSAPVNGVLSMDLSIRLRDITVQAAAT